MIQKSVIKYVLKPLSKIVKGLNDKQREMIFILCGLILFSQYFLHGTGIVSIPYMVEYAVGCACMGMMILAFLKEDIKEVRFNRLLVLAWFLVGFLMLIAALRFNKDWISEALLYLAACPIAFIVWANYDYEKLLKAFIKIGAVSFIAYVCVSMVFYPIGDKQYSGLFTNVNAAAEFLTLAFACVLIQYLKEKNKIKNIVCAIGLGICAALIFYTNSRTGQLAAILSFVVTIILFVLQDLKQWKQRILYKILPIIVVTILCIPTTVYVIQVGNELGRIVTSGLQEKPEAAPSDEGSPEAEPPVEESPETETPDEGSSETTNSGAESFIEFNEHKTDTETKNLDDVSTGRVSIWKAYLENVEIFGSGKEEKFWIESRDAYYTTAHMMPLTLAFRYGWICAVIYLIYNVLAGIEAIKFGLKKKNVYALLPIAITIGFGVTSVLASINTPFVYILTMYYYFVQSVLIVNIKNAKSKDEA